MTKISNFGKQNSILGSVVPLAMFSCHASGIQIYTFTLSLKGKLTTFMSFLRIQPVVDLNSDDHENVADCRYDAPVGGISNHI